MKSSYEGLKEIRVDVDEIWRKMLGFGVSIGLLPLFWLSHEMKSSYEGLKEIEVDVDEIWRKMLGFGVCIGLLPLILIVSWNEIQLWEVWKFERNPELMLMRYEGKC